MGDVRSGTKTTMRVIGVCLLTASIVFALSFTGCSGRARTRSNGVPKASLSDVTSVGAADGMNLLLVTLDTVRRDRLGCYGYDLAETPTIDGLAQHGVVFEDAVAPAPITLPSHATMLTGLYPPNHGVRDNGLFTLGQKNRTLTEILSDRGYETAAFVSSFTLDARYGLDQGFQLYDFTATPHGGTALADRRSAGSVTDAAIGWLKKRSSRGDSRPFFIWIHYFDAHVPYDSPYSTLKRFRDRPYDGEIAYIDANLARLIETLRSMGLTDETLIAVVSDHGESFGEHGEKTHGVLLHEATMGVAFILSCPTLFDAQYRVGNCVVGLVDLKPTLEQLLGLAAPDTTDGIGLVTEASNPDRALYIETMLPFYSAKASPLIGMRRHRDKLVQGVTREYYDLTKDPLETQDLYASDNAEAQDLVRELKEVTTTFSDATTSSSRAVDPEEAERLRSLGYTSAAASGEGVGLPAPSTMLEAQELMGDAFESMKAGKLSLALETNERARNLCPLFKDPILQRMAILERMGREDEAVQTAAGFLEGRPDAEVAIAEARILMKLGRFDEMESALATAASIDPENGYVYIIRGDRFCTQGLLSDAIKEYEKALKVDGQRLGPTVEPQIARLRQAIAAAGR